jgi:hypothetical protein
MFSAFGMFNFGCDCWLWFTAIASGQWRLGLLHLLYFKKTQKNSSKDRHIHTNTRFHPYHQSYSLPPSPPTVDLTQALSMLGKPNIHLNYTLSPISYLRAGNM